MVRKNCSLLYPSTVVALDTRLDANIILYFMFLLLVPYVDAVPEACNICHVVGCGVLKFCQKHKHIRMTDLNLLSQTRMVVTFGFKVRHIPILHFPVRHFPTLLFGPLFSSPPFFSSTVLLSLFKPS